MARCWRRYRHRRWDGLIGPVSVSILTSGYTDEGTREELVGLGAAGFIQKPYTIMVLAAALRQGLQKAGLGQS